MLLENLLLFGRVLRRAGVDVHHGRLMDAVRATEWIGIGRRDDVRATLRALLVHRHEDLARFDDEFDRFFRPHVAIDTPDTVGAELPPSPSAMAGPSEARSAKADARPDDKSASSAKAGIVASALEALRTKDFEDFTAEELHQAHLVLAGLPWRLGVRRTRRWETSSGGAIDLRPVLRRNLMRGGEPIELPRRARRTAPRPIVLLGDVSGSMERYSRMLLQFVFGLAKSETRVEAFVFSTRLTHVTRRVRLASRFGSAEPALRTHESRAGAAELRFDATRTRRIIHDVHDWGGGTRIGDALRTFNMRWARRVMRNGPVVLIVSDGWDRGDPDLLARELARLRRNCRRLIWLNPLLGRANYEPLTRGMQAALGHIDDFLPAHNLASFEDLARHLTALPAGHRRADLAPHRAGVRGGGPATAGPYTRHDVGADL